MKAAAPIHSRRHAAAVFPALAVLGSPGPAVAHAGEQGFVLLLPTGLYTAGGAVSVVLTVLVLAVLPAPAVARLFRPVPLMRLGRGVRGGWPSLLGFLLLAALVALGVLGPHDPTRNLLPLAVWNGFWIFLVLAQGVFGDIWRRFEPWSAPYAVYRRVVSAPPPLCLPARLGRLPALLSFLGFAAVLLAHPAPTDPERLARLVAGYWLLHFAGMVLFGPRWLSRAEGLGVLMAAYARLAPFGRRGGRLCLGLPGWRWVGARAPGAGSAAFLVAMLAVGSFDGLNETFRYLGWIGVNPLEFPGRSAIVGANLAGLGLALAALGLAYAAAILAGQQLARERGGLGAALRAYAPALLPIAFGYHAAHYLPSALVEGQYLARALGDATGLWQLQVTTGFFNQLGSARAIWLSQAGAVVGGHVLAILMSHAIALRRAASPRAALLGQAPLAAFMVAYTVFGLWLLASPRGA